MALKASSGGRRLRSRKKKVSFPCKIISSNTLKYAAAPMPSNPAGVLFELLGKTNDRTLITSAGSYLGGAFYQLYRALHRASGGKEGYFGLDATAYQSGAVDAQMRADYIAYASSLAQLSEKDGAFASMEDEALASLYPGLMQSVTQVLHSTEEKTNSLLGRK